MFLRLRCRTAEMLFEWCNAVQVGDDLWVVHAFQKKSTDGIKTPKREVDLIRDRIKRLKEILR